MAHAVVVLPVVLITWVVTALWWFAAAATLTFPLRNQLTPGSQYPMVLDLGSGHRHQPAARVAGLHVAFAMTLGLVLLLTLPLVTRVGVAAQAGLGQALLWDASALHRRISGLEQEREPPGRRPSPR